MVTGNNQQLTEEQKRRGAAARLPLERFVGSVPIMKNYECGEMVEGQGIYLGRYAPIDREGRSLGKIFNVFAAPEDLPELMMYDDAVKHISGLKDWHGYDGTNYATDKEFYAAVKNGSYNGGWIIPTRDILHGKDVAGKDSMSDNFFNCQNKGAFKGTFKTKTAAFPISSLPHWYWSSTEHRALASDVWAAQPLNGYTGEVLKNNGNLSCRPVRLVEVGVSNAPKQ